MELKKIKITDVVVVSNARKLFFEEAIKELAESISSVGLLQPIGVIPDGKKFKLLYGERRLRACQLLKLKEIDCKVFENLSEHEQSLIHLTENIQRRDLTAYEEMKALNDLKQSGMSVEELSQKIGRSLKYVYDRLNLCLLVPGFMQMLESGTLQVSHARELIRLTNEDQLEILEMWGDGFQLIELKDLIKKNFNLKLSNAPFDLNDQALLLGAGSCIDCEKRSGCNRKLFEDVEQTDICFDKNCYQMKINNFIDATQGSWEQAGVKVIRVSDRWLSEKDRKEKGVRLLSDFMQVPKESIKNHSRKAIALIVDSFGKVGRYVDILSDEQKKEYDAELESLTEKVSTKSKPVQEAELKFTNDLLGNIAREVSLNQFKAPRGFRIANIIGLFMSIPISDQVEIAVARNWMTFPGYTTIDEKQFNDRQATANTVYHNIKHASDNTLSEIEFTLQVFVLKCLHVNSESFELLTSIASDCKVDTVKILDEVNEQFGVNINVELF